MSHGTTPTATPTPVPTSTATPTSTPTPTPTPTATTAPPIPTATQTAGPPAPVVPSAPVTFGNAGSLGAALDGSSEAQLNSLLAATSAGGFQSTAVNNGLNQLLGFAQQPTPQQAQQLMGLVSPLTVRVPGLAVDQISFAAMDLQSLLMSVQNDRASLLNTQLAAQIADVQARNARIATLNAAMSAVTAYLASRPEANSAALRCFRRVQHPGCRRCRT